MTFWWKVIDSIEENWRQCDNIIRLPQRKQSPKKSTDQKLQPWYTDEEWYKVCFTFDRFCGLGSILHRQAATEQISGHWYEKIPPRDRYDIAACSCIASEPVSLLREFVIRNLIAGLCSIILVFRNLLNR